MADQVAAAEVRPQLRPETVTPHKATTAAQDQQPQRRKVAAAAAVAPAQEWQGPARQAATAAQL
jgi:hypothetical protein